MACRNWQATSGHLARPPPTLLPELSNGPSWVGPSSPRRSIEEETRSHLRDHLGLSRLNLGPVKTVTLAPIWAEIPLASGTFTEEFLALSSWPDFHPASSSGQLSHGEYLAKTKLAGSKKREKI